MILKNRALGSCVLWIISMAVTAIPATDDTFIQFMYLYTFISDKGKGMCRAADWPLDICFNMLGLFHLSLWQVFYFMAIV